MKVTEDFKSLKLTTEGAHPYLAAEVDHVKVMFDTPDTGGGPFYVYGIDSAEFAKELARRWNAFEEPKP